MSDSEDLYYQAGGDLASSAGGNGNEANIVPFPPAATADAAGSTTITGNGYHAGRSHSPDLVSFSRRELDRILHLYGFKVASGEWRDYAIDMLKDRAVFSVYRRTSEVPLHCIEKIPKLARKQGAWAVTGADGRILKRGRDLDAVLKVLEGKKARLRVV